MDKNNKFLPFDPFTITPEQAKEITGITFTEEELKVNHTSWLIAMYGLDEKIIKSKDKCIEFLEKEIALYKPVTQTKKQSQTVNIRSNPESSRAFLKVVV